MRLLSPTRYIQSPLYLCYGLWRVIAAMDYKMSSYLFMAGKSDCVSEHSPETNEKCKEMSAVTPSNWGELVGLCLSAMQPQLKEGTIKILLKSVWYALLPLATTTTFYFRLRSAIQPWLRSRGKLQQILQIPVHVK